MSMRADVVVVLRAEALAFDVISEITGRDGVVHEHDCENGVIEATVEAAVVGELRRLPGVAYVREVMAFAENA